MKRQQPIRPCTAGSKQVGPAMSDPTGNTGGMKKELPFAPSAPTQREIGSAQLDFPLPATSRRAARRQRPCSRERAAWWFAQMRRVVEEGREAQVTGVW